MALRHFLAPAVCAAALAPCLLSQKAAISRPAIPGIAHIALKTNDLNAAREFYGHYLGFAEPFPGPNGSAVFKVNDRQYIEVANTLSGDEDRLDDIAFETTDARKMRDYLAEHGVTVPAKVATDAGGDYSFTIEDPEGHRIEFVEYRKGSLVSRNFGKALAATRISERIIHCGFTIQDAAAADKLYAADLGFHATWHGGMNDTRTDWVDMRVPNGPDWLEYMLNQPHPSVKTRGVMNHLALGVPDAKAAYAELEKRGLKMDGPPKIGRDGKWQLNLYDPNFTRAELMEPKPVQPPCCSPFLDK
ncbi:MAG TPA: VOC family protein [Bryobacteraceae bacterium]|jgi:catechol 2,3-dioxygenase-like lactoylglutathione lyase family enzyme|nr:VOC family protein [Bryobacteraceae bacterium]